jgi:hypothetical protein
MILAVIALAVVLVLFVSWLVGGLLRGWRR